MSRMRQVIKYIQDYFRSLSPAVFGTCTLFIAVAIFCNYYFGLNARINALPNVPQFFSWFFVFFTAFVFGYAVEAMQAKSNLFQNLIFLFLLVAAPAVFAWKMMAHFHFSFSLNPDENYYWNHVLYWPMKLLVVLVILYFLWNRFHPEQPFYGTSTKSFDVRPYLGMLLLMLPLLLWAATQRDFLAVYPKMKNIPFLVSGGTWYYKLLYELSYGSDFFTIEFFFRGFLVLAFAKWAGKDAVLPMALFYCTIHFGKPLGECISSYFGGMILGAVILQTRSIWGGLMVHLGIAWLMEAFGYLGHLYIK